MRFYKCVGIQSQSAWLRENLTTDANGYIAYTLKASGEEPGEVRDTCILISRFNAANRYKALFTEAKLAQYSEQLDVPFWEVRIAWADLADVLVPLGTDGIFYAGRYTQIREVVVK